MTCQEAQDAILLADNPAEFESNPELARHLVQCAGCRALSERLVRLERTAASLPAPGSEAGKLAALRHIRCLENLPGRRLILRPAFLSAIAALLLISVGLGMYFSKLEQPTPPTVVDRLIDWDLELAEAPASQQPAIFSARASALQSEVHSASLSEDDRELASTLLQHGTWLCVNSDPVDRAEKFSDLSDLILARMHRAAAANDAKAMQRLSQRYDLVVRGGIGGNLARMGANASISPENSKKLERIAKRNAEQERKLQLLAERASKALERDLHRALEVSKRQSRNLNGRTF